MNNTILGKACLSFILTNHKADVTLIFTMHSNMNRLFGLNKIKQVKINPQESRLL